VAGADPGKHPSKFVPITLSEGTENAIFVVGHCVGGIVGLIGAILTTADALSDDENSAYETPAGVASAVSAISNAAAGVFASPYPIQDSAVSDLRGATIALTLLGKVSFALAPKAIIAKRKINDPGEQDALRSKLGRIGAGFSALVAVIDLAPTCYHFYELSQDPANSDRTESIMDEVANLCSDLGRLAAFTVVMDEDPLSKALLAGILGSLLTMTGGLQIAESIVQAASSSAALVADGSGVSATTPNAGDGHDQQRPRRGSSAASRRSSTRSGSRPTTASTRSRNDPTR
jgi:hypothetical protein